MSTLVFIKLEGCAPCARFDPDRKKITKHIEEKTHNSAETYILSRSQPHQQEEEFLQDFTIYWFPFIFAISNTDLQKLKGRLYTFRELVMLSRVRIYGGVVLNEGSVAGLNVPYGSKDILEWFAGLDIPQDELPIKTETETNFPMSMENEIYLGPRGTAFFTEDGRSFTIKRY